MLSVSQLPTVNACLNLVAAFFLFLGYKAAKNDNPRLHMKMMICALASSALFLASYLYYHYNAGAMTKYTGEGLLRLFYFFVLFTHIPLAGLIVPACLIAVWYAIVKQYDKHTRITRVLWPVWMYVSLTGVLIYLMLYVW